MLLLLGIPVYVWMTPRHRRTAPPPTVVLQTNGRLVQPTEPRNDVSVGVDSH
jgi:hypothetical protein